MQKGTNKTNSDVSSLQKASETMDTVFSFENLYQSFEKCTLGVKWKQSTQNYMFNASCRIARLRNKILNKNYKAKPFRYFTVCERGKTRNISALTFEDRIVHKCLCDNFLVPLLSKKLIYDSGATLKGKGLGFTRRRIVCHLQKYYRYHGNKGYVLKIDFHNYFESIDHNVLFSKLRRAIENESLFEFTKSCISLNKKGLGLGSQISQISAMFYLNELDHFIKEKLKIKYYARYMDDLYLIHYSKKVLRNSLFEIRELSKKLKINISKNKTKISLLSKGFVFCKTRYFLLETGKILKFPVGHAISVFNRKSKKGIDLLSIIPSFKSYVLQFNCYKILLKSKLQYILLL